MSIQFFFSSDWVSNYPLGVKIMVVLGFIISLIVQILDIKDNFDKRELKKEVINWRKEAIILLETHIYNFSKKLDFGKDNSGFTNRLSVYKKYNECFYCVGRYSDSEELKKNSTKLYVNKGILFKIWDKGNRGGHGFFDNKIPDSKENWRAYKKYHKTNYGFTDSDLNALHMKSLLYFGYRIENEKGIPESIVLFESTNRNKFTSVELDDIFKKGITPLNHVLKFVLPNITKPNIKQFITKPLYGRVKSL